MGLHQLLRSELSGSVSYWGSKRVSFGVRRKTRCEPVFRQAKPTLGTTAGSNLRKTVVALLASWVRTEQLRTHDRPATASVVGSRAVAPGPPGSQGMGDSLDIRPGICDRSIVGMRLR